MADTIHPFLQPLVTSTTQQISAATTQAIQSVQGDDTTIPGITDVVAAKVIDIFQYLNKKLILLNTAIGNLANQSDLLTLTNTVTQLQTNLLQVQTTLANKANASDLVITTSTANTALTEANKRLLRSGDTSTGNQNVPSPVAASNAVPLGWLAGGVGQPFRFFTNVGATPVSADDITNPFPMGNYVLWIDKLSLILTTQPTLTSTTLTITSTVNGVTSTIFSKLITALPATNNLLDILSITNTPVPATTGLPVTLKASLSNGAIGTVIISGKLQKVS